MVPNRRGAMFSNFPLHMKQNWHFSLDVEFNDEFRTANDGFFVSGTVNKLIYGNIFQEGEEIKPMPEFV